MSGVLSSLCDGAQLPRVASPTPNHTYTYIDIKRRRVHPLPQLNHCAHPNKLKKVVGADMAGSRQQRAPVIKTPPCHAAMTAAVVALIIVVVVALVDPLVVYPVLRQ